ncbi:MAG: hypothetical protein C0623_08745 [Desulfuromonas sp.]|nr:MAG: hypothetical protein C0623_08745 [Desulfuromonas sp.]
MILLDIFKRKKKLTPLFKKCWQRIGDEIIYPAVVEDDPPQKIVYYGLLSYATIYEVAVAVGMEPSTGHYLARMQVGKFKLGADVTRIVEATFSGLERADDIAYADLFHNRVGRMVEMICDDGGDITPLLQELANAYKPVTLTTTTPKDN